MADEIEAGGAGESGAAADPESEHASAFLERAAERAGLGQGAQEESGEKAVATQAEATPSWTPHVPDPKAAHEDFRRRREQQREAEARQRVLSEVAERLDRIEAGLGREEAPAAVDDPEPDMHENYGEWVAWRERQLEARLLEKINGQLAPVTQFFQGQQEIQRQQAEQRRREAAARGWMDENASIARESHAAYLQRPEGQGFGERLSWYFGHPGRAADPARGEAGVEPYDGVITRGLVRGGVDIQSARLMAIANYRAMHEFAVARGLDPAVLVDSVIRTELESVAAYRSGGQAAQPAAGSPAAGSPAGAAKRMRQTAESAAAVAGSATDAQAGATSTRDLRQVMLSGDLTPAKVKEIARAKGWSERKAVAEMRRINRELAAG